MCRNHCEEENECGKSTVVVRMIAAHQVIGSNPVFHSFLLFTKHFKQSESSAPSSLQCCGYFVNYFVIKPPSVAFHGESCSRVV